MKATRGSSGAGILLGKEFITKYAISINDESADGILELKWVGENSARKRIRIDFWRIRPAFRIK